MACYRLRARRVARVAHAETARVCPEAVPHRPAVPGRRVAFALIAGGMGRAMLHCCAPVGRAHFLLRARGVVRVAHAETARVPRPSHTPALALAAASLVCTSARARRSLQAKWVLTGGMVAAHVVASQTRGVRTDGCRGTQISTHEHRVGGGATRIASDRRWPPWPPWPPLGCHL